MRLTLSDDAVVTLETGADLDRTFEEVCESNPNARVEQTKEGAILIMPPAGLESSHRNNGISARLYIWAEADSRGVTFDSNTVFLLPDGSKLRPDAAWIRNEKNESLSDREIEGFCSGCSGFCR